MAEGFEYEDCLYVPESMVIDAYPLLIHRAVEGWNKNQDIEIYIETSALYISLYQDGVYRKRISDYKPQSLTQAECAMLDCMLDIFKESM